MQYITTNEGINCTEKFNFKVRLRGHLLSINSLYMIPITTYKQKNNTIFILDVSVFLSQ